MSSFQGWSDNEIISLMNKWVLLPNTEAKRSVKQSFMDKIISPFEFYSKVFEQIQNYAGSASCHKSDKHVRIWK